MSWLHCFSDYRAMQAEVYAAAASLVVAENQANLWRARCEVAEGRIFNAIEAERSSLKMVANAEAIRSGSSVVPFPDVYVPMPEPARDEEEITPEPRKRRADTLVREMEREFASEYAAQLDRELG